MSTAALTSRDSITTAIFVRPSEAKQSIVVTEGSVVQIASSPNDTFPLTLQFDKCYDQSKSDQLTPIDATTEDIFNTLVNPLLAMKGPSGSRHALVVLHASIKCGRFHIAAGARKVHSKEDDGKKASTTEVWACDSGDHLLRRCLRAANKAAPDARVRLRILEVLDRGDPQRFFDDFVSDDNLDAVIAGIFAARTQQRALGHLCFSLLLEDSETRREAVSPNVTIVCLTPFVGHRQAVSLISALREVRVRLGLPRSVPLSGALSASSPWSLVVGKAFSNPKWVGIVHVGLISGHPTQAKTSLNVMCLADNVSRIECKVRLRQKTPSEVWAAFGSPEEVVVKAPQKLPPIHASKPAGTQRVALPLPTTRVLEREPVTQPAALVTPRPPVLPVGRAPPRPSRPVAKESPSTVQEVKITRTVTTTSVNPAAVRDSNAKERRPKGTSVQSSAVVFTNDRMANQFVGTLSRENEGRRTIAQTEMNERTSLFLLYIKFLQDARNAQRIAPKKPSVNAPDRQRPAPGVTSRKLVEEVHHPPPPPAPPRPSSSPRPAPHSPHAPSAASSRSRSPISCRSKSAVSRSPSISSRSRSPVSSRSRSPNSPRSRSPLSARSRSPLSSRSRSRQSGSSTPRSAASSLRTRSGPPVAVTADIPLVSQHEGPPQHLARAIPTLEEALTRQGMEAEPSSPRTVTTSAAPPKLRGAMFASHGVVDVVAATKEVGGAIERMDPLIAKLRVALQDDAPSTTALVSCLDCVASRSAEEYNALLHLDHLLDVDDMDVVYSIGVFISEVIQVLGDPVLGRDPKVEEALTAAQAAAANLVGLLLIRCTGSFDLAAVVEDHGILSKACEGRGVPSLLDAILIAVSRRSADGVTLSSMVWEDLGKTLQSLQTVSTETWTVLNEAVSRAPAVWSNVKFAVRSAGTPALWQSKVVAADADISRSALFSK